MKHSKFARIMAIVAIVLLVGMYVTSLVFALIHNSFANTMLKISLTGTFAIPVIIYLIMMFYRLSHPKDKVDED